MQGIETESDKHWSKRKKKEEGEYGVNIEEQPKMQALERARAEGI